MKVLLDIFTPNKGGDNHRIGSRPARPTSRRCGRGVAIAARRRPSGNLLTDSGERTSPRGAKDAIIIASYWLIAPPL